MNLENMIDPDKIITQVIKISIESVMNDLKLP